MKNPKINYEEYELTNGECVAMSTAPILMLALRKSDKKSYETLSKVLVKGVNDKDALEVAEFLYAAYKNANQDEEGTMTFTDFFENMDQDWSRSWNSRRRSWSCDGRGWRSGSRTNSISNSCNSRSGGWNGSLMEQKRIIQRFHNRNY